MTQRKSHQRLSGSCIIMLVLLGVIVVLMIITGMPLSTLNPFSSNPEPIDPATPIDAAGMCKQFVIDQLLAPKTADFQNVYEAQVTETSPDTFTVNSYVDADNEFGVPIRLNYQCKVNYTENNQWRLLDLEMPLP